MNKKRFMWWSGVGLCALGIVVGAKVPYFYLHSKFAGANLVREAENTVSEQSNQWTVQKNSPMIRAFPLMPVLNGDTQILSGIPSDSAIGLVRISALHLIAPFLEGTTDKVLNVGVGHLQGSANPGMPGTCLIAAHNATWFRHLDLLRPGDSIVLQTQNAEYDYKVTGARIVNTKDGVANTAKQTIVLEACYPLDALYLTSKRYLVFGELTSVRAKYEQFRFPSSPSPKYVAQIPKDILRQGVTQSNNELPMGVLRIEGNPSLSYTESNAPLSAVYTILQLYLSYVHASCNKNVADLNQIIQTVAGADGSVAWLNRQILHDPFFGVQQREIIYDSQFDITLQVIGDNLTSAIATTVVQVPSGRYQIEIEFSVKGNTFSILSIDIHN